MALKTVVLPAPFGPMTEKICPGWTARSTPLTAVTPPNRIVRPLTLRRDIATSRVAGGAGFQFVLVPRLRQQAGRPEPHHHDQHDSEDEEPPAAHLQILLAPHPVREHALEPLALELVVELRS